MRRPTYNAVDGHDFTEDNTNKENQTEGLVEGDPEDTYLMRFFVRIRGARTPPPNIDAPVRNIPLCFVRIKYVSDQRHLAHF
jgi:hypothetical protein